MTPEFKLIIITLIASSIGAIVRILHENEKYPIKKSKVFLVYFCSIAIGYICHELAVNFGKEDFIGVASIIGGIISTDLVNLIIDKAPNIIFKYFNKKTRE